MSWKNLFGLFIGLLTLSGCGENTTSTSQPSGKSTPTHTTKTISYLDKEWQVTIPQDWEILPVQPQSLFMAQKQDKNFVVLERLLQTNAIGEEILKSAKKDFFEINIKNKTENIWNFTGKLKPHYPTRAFWQKIYTVPGATTYLLGSCSYEVRDQQKNDCVEILEQWKPMEEEGA